MKGWNLLKIKEIEIWGKNELVSLIIWTEKKAFANFRCYQGHEEMGFTFGKYGLVQLLKANWQYPINLHLYKFIPQIYKYEHKQIFVKHYL